jgi:hypothetical protein
MEMSPQSTESRKNCALPFAKNYRSTRTHGEDFVPYFRAKKVGFKKISVE